MKKALLFASIIILPLLLSAQQELGQIDVSKWKLFSTDNNKQLKKIDDNTMFAFYRTGSMRSGIMIFDKSMNVIRDIPLDDKIGFTYFPYVFYRPDARAIVLIGLTKNDRKDYSVTGITYSIDGAGLMTIQELAGASSDYVYTRHSDNEEYFYVAEVVKKQKGKDERVLYNVFDKECQKLYSVEGDLLKGGDNYSKLLNNGELIRYSIKEEGRKITYLFTKYDSSGNSETISFAPPKTDIYSYDKFNFDKTDEGIYFASFMKYRTKAEGFVILKMDFDNKTVKKIADKTIDKTSLAKINAIKTKSVAMVGKKLKPIKDFDTYSIYRCSADDANIYVILEDKYIKTTRDTKSGEVKYKTYGSDGLIVACYDHNGKEKWITPIKRMASSREIARFDNYFNGKGRSIGISSYETPEDLCFILKSRDQTYYTRVNKITGKDISPVLLLKDSEINSNCIGWFNYDEVVVLSMYGIDVISRDEFWLKGFKISKIEI